MQEIARRVMRERGLDPDFPPQALSELNRLHPDPAEVDGARDLRRLLWCSIDNDDSRDLDQLSCAERLPSGGTRLYVAVADVDSLVRKRMALDDHARRNTTSVYTVAQTFPMLPERLSTDLTSLNLESDRRSIVVEMAFSPDATLGESRLYPAIVRNRAKLAYNSVALWLEGGPVPPAISAVPGLAENLRLQDGLARGIRSRRLLQGALALETIQTQPVFEGQVLKALRLDRRNRAKDLIEDFMIAANGVVARYLSSKGFPAIRRIVRTPRRWDRIAAIAAERGTNLPRTPDQPALEAFLQKEKASNPGSFPDLSLCVIKLLGSGEYVVEMPGQVSAGHFGLAVRDYTHSTAPNRRFPDLLTQRLIKAAVHGAVSPYSRGELTDLARHCTEAEDAVKKIERQVAKCAAALLLQSRIGEEFDAVITAVANKGTFLRLFEPPTEGMLVGAHDGKDTGDTIRVKLVAVDPDRGHIDFAFIR